jgi:hypothetical protein
MANMSKTKAAVDYYNESIAYTCYFYKKAQLFTAERSIIY